MNISYDYTELLDELHSDLSEELIRLSSFIKIVRDKSRQYYHPIIDYYYDDYEVHEDHDRVRVYEVLQEMEQYNKIL